MFRNTALLVKPVRDRTPVEPTTPAITMEEAQNLTSHIAGSAVGVVAVYMIADTLRKVIVHTAQAKIK